MPDLPRAVLSREMGDRLSGRRLVSAVFLTYRFDPGFFEQEVLPVFFDVSFSHSTAIRLVQLEDILRSRRGQVAVYYDSNGLEQTDYGSARLDVRRIPVQHRHGVFHPKNVFALVEATEPDENNHHARSLLVASLSANLTRAGWWENVEACHVEEIPEGSKTRLHDDLLAFLQGLKKKTRAEQEHAALHEITSFLNDTEQRAQKSSDGMLHPHFYYGKQSLVDFLDEVAGDELRGKNLEIVSPYFDHAQDSKPLDDLLARFEPREVRVFLPRGDKGEVLCEKAFFDAVRHKDNVHWAHLPGELVRMGKAQEAANRFVHAKVLRFFSANPKREIVFVGSANLTKAAFSGSKNVETGFLIDTIPPRRPEFWMVPDDRPRTSFVAQGEDEGPMKSGGTRLRLRFHWGTALAEVYWDDKHPSPDLHVEAQNELLFAITPLVPQEWIALDQSIGLRLKSILHGTSILTVHGDGDEPGVLLVQEEGMAYRPSLLQDLSAADILRSWSLLSPEQRSAFIEARADDLMLLGSAGAELVASARLAQKEDSMFDHFAGFFHAFTCLEKSIEEARQEDDDRKATYLLFGKKYDSLGTLLARILNDQAAHDLVDRYVMISCARQLVQKVRARWPAFWSAHAADVQELEGVFEKAAAIRSELLREDPREMPRFLDWFDAWFFQNVDARKPKGGAA